MVAQQMVEVQALVTPRLFLEPITLPVVEATFRGDRAAIEDLVRARVPKSWPGRALVERAFSASLERIRADPETRLWGDRLMITRMRTESSPLISHFGGANSRSLAGSLEDSLRPAASSGDLDEDEDSLPRVVVGSVIFHGRPADGVAEVGYGVEERWQRQGFATEATRTCVEWALTQPGIQAVTATTPPWHTASIRVLEKSGLVRLGVEEHDALGEVLRFKRIR